MIDSVPGAASGLWTLLAETAATAGDRPAVRDSTGETSYRELTRTARRVAVWLRGRGIRRGDRVLVCASSERVTVAVLFGCLRIGAVFVPFGPGVTVHQLGQVVADARPAVLLAASQEHLSLVPRAAGVLLGDLVSALPADVDGDVVGAVSEDDAAVLLYTSGSTAAPKAVVCTHAQVLFAARAVASRVGYRAEDVVFCRLPLSFDYGLYQVFLCAMASAALVLVPPGRDVHLLSEVCAAGATVVPVVPSMAAMLVALARGRVLEGSRVRLFTNTGEHLPAATAAALRHAFPAAGVQLMFGITECKRVTVLEVDGDLARPGSVGLALPGTRVRVVDESGAEVPAGVVGEISVYGPHVMAGYWRAPELTDQRFRVDAVTGERFLLTGDYGHLDDDGHLYFTGRRDHVFKHRGVRVSTVEIESAAMSLPGVRAAAVLPPVGTAGPVLCVAASGTGQEVLRGLRELLGTARTPSQCRVVPALPLTANGKVDRRKLAELPEVRS
ncbi:class I adenylate-forming enzyme family protein [Actinokineospora globicatena]|uniref:class I adenylate-forming enzyme family protein n=1 Tax=Actinokineospora globicatena TaxID=103729 RepID=UPI0020A58A21|nr:class I adenylate-forming enzyme family protein [Actinokineospora globicatena]MCP2303911.1 amino acid adenylation domain-containing protein [Actinokineospora globicatena]GLW78929.1 AMP-dependent ligase [Actinokineospora globicatena]GLW86659.1 AMP-dependent ligase [Actinokineospora globicatena]